MRNKIKSSKIIRRILKDHVSPYKKQIYLAVFFMVIVAVCAAIIVRLVQPVIDKVFLTHDRHLMLIIPFLMLTIYSLKGIAEYFQCYIVKYVGQQILTNLQMKMYEHLLLTDLTFIQSQSAGRLISRFTNDIILMRGAVSNLLVGCVKHFLSVVFLIILMFKLEPVLSFFVFTAFPLAIYPIQKIGRKMRIVIGNAQEELSNYTARLDETLHAIKVIKSFGGEQIEVKRSTEITAKILEHFKKAAKFDALTSPIMEILSGLAIACILWYGGFMVIEGNISPGALFAFITAFVSAYRPFKSLVSLNVNLQEGIAAAERVFHILDTKPLIFDKEDAKTPIFTCPSISLNNVELHFDKKIAIKYLNLKIEKGKTYAFVGRSGSGKTSIANLLIRFYDPTSGQVLIDGYNEKDIVINHLRKQIALVTQDTILFDTTVADNIAYGKPDTSKEAIIEAAKAADAHEFISLLPHGYDTIIGVSGQTLSGGQRQRLAIARAFLKDAPILILDEATSALDPNSEQTIINSIAKLRKNRTTLIITHRLSCVQNSDQIIVMKSGTIVEQGTHKKLLIAKGEYYKLYNKESKEVIENV